jgi:hypothetical protein
MNHQASLGSAQEIISTFKTVLHESLASGSHKPAAPQRKPLPRVGLQAQEIPQGTIVEATGCPTRSPEPAMPDLLAVAGESYARPLSVRAATLCRREIWFVRLTLWRGPLFAQHWHRDRKPTFGPLPPDQSWGIGVSLACPYSPFGKALTACFMRKFKQSWISPSVHWNISLPTIVANDSEIVELASLGNVEGMVRLFQSGRASPTDTTPQGNTLLHVCFS